MKKKHHSKKKDKMAHASHHHMNAAHGTPAGFHAGEEYGDESEDKGLEHASSHGTPMTAPYHGNDGPGVPDLEGNACEDCG
jgi:hypothetical protein